MGSNLIQHYLNYDGIRLTIADTSSAAAEAILIHQLSLASAAILSKVMTGAAILANDFKNQEGVSFKWSTGGPLGNIHADAYGGHFVRGYIDHPEAAGDLPCDPGQEARLVSADGTLFVTRYSLLKMPYTSAVCLSGGDIAENLTRYLTVSEQTQSVVFLLFDADKSTEHVRSWGCLVQLLPTGNKESFDALVRRCIHTEKTVSGAAIPLSVQTLIEEGRFELLKESPLSFQCTCSEERIRSALMRLPAADREDLLKDPYIEFVCHYCGKKYTISRDVLAKWLNENQGEVH